MSELIDRIFDVEKISGEINAILANINSLNTSLSGLTTNIKGVSDEARKAKDVGALSDASAKLNNNFVEGQKTMKSWQDEVAKLNEKTKQLTDTEKQANIEIAKARLELQAAQKATKEAAIAEIELTAKNKDLSGSYNALQKDLQNSIKAYKALSGEEAKSAKGKELLTKIGETQTALKKSDAAMGNYQRNVGNYQSALEGLTPKLGGLAGKLIDIANAAKASRDEINEASGDNGLGIMAKPQLPAGLSTIITGFKGIGQSVIAMGKAVLANPILAVIAAIVAVFQLMKSAVDSNGEATERISRIMAPFKMILTGVMQVIGLIVDSWLKGVEAIGEFANAIMSFIPGLDKLAEKNKEAIRLEKEKQSLVRQGIVDSSSDAKEELRIAELKKKIGESDKYSKKERLAMAREIDKAEKTMAYDDAVRANNNLKNFLGNMKLIGKTQKQYTLDELKQLNDLQTAKYKAQQDYFDKTKKTAKMASTLAQSIADEEKAAQEKAAADAKEAANKIVEARRRLIDSQIALMKDGKEKEIRVSQETYNRQIEDLRNNGELSKELLKNLTKAQLIEVDKIKKEWQLKSLSDNIKADELTLENMKKAGQDTLNFEKEILKDKMKAEIMAGGAIEEIKKKYKFLEIDLEQQSSDKKIALFEKEIAKQSEMLSSEYKQKELNLKKDFAKTKQTEDDKAKYEHDLAQLKLDSLLETNNKTIELLNKELEMSGLSADKKAELSKKLADLQIENENAVTDATIKNNEDRVKADKDAIAKRIEVAEALGNATQEIFGAIANFVTQQSEQRVAELEKEQEASDAKFEKEQGNLDNAIMSDENRADKQKELNEKKAASDKAIADKIQAEKIKQAKWEKANAIVQAIITAGLSILKASLAPPPLGLISAGLAATMAAIQVATIISQPIPAYAKGTDNHPGGLSLWGEVRPEVAVTPSGDAFLAEKPTITNFDSGTKIYKSVSDYENFIAKQAVQQMTFDYDKFGELMPKLDVAFDANGLLIMRDKQGNRRTILNRRYNLR